jgi:hypothetical protein
MWLVRFGGSMRTMFDLDWLLPSCWWLVLEYVAGDTPRLDRIRISPNVQALPPPTPPAANRATAVPNNGNNAPAHSSDTAQTEPEHNKGSEATGEEKVALEGDSDGESRGTDGY